MGDLRDQVSSDFCCSWSALSKELDDLTYAKKQEQGSHWIYRGERNAEWWLKPSIERLRDDLKKAGKGLKVSQMERQLCFDFNSQAALFLKHVPKPGSHLEWLAAAQHYGVPTRLLDWTYSPAVAAYFAMCDVDIKATNGHACVWALNVGALKREVARKLGVDDWRAGYELALARVTTELDPDLITPYLPSTMHSRLSTQQGLFLLNTSYERPFMETLDSVRSLGDKQFIRRFKIPYSCRVEILARLLEFNIHALSLFPGPDGLGRHVRLKADIQAQTVGLD